MYWTLCHALRLRLFSFPTAHATLTGSISSIFFKSQVRLLHELQSQRWRIDLKTQNNHVHHFSTLSSSYIHQNNLSTCSSTSSSSQSSKCQTFSSSTLLLTETAKKRLKELFSSSEETNGKISSYLRISVEGGGCSGFQYKFQMDSKKIDDTEDIVLSSGRDGDKGRVVIDKPSLDILKGSKIDYQMELIRSAFRIIDIPAAGDGCSCGASFTVKID